MIIIDLIKMSLNLLSFHNANLIYFNAQFPNLMKFLLIPWLHKIGPLFYTPGKAMHETEKSDSTPLITNFNNSGRHTHISTRSTLMPQAVVASSRTV